MTFPRPQQRTGSILLRLHYSATGTFSNSVHSVLTSCLSIAHASLSYTRFPSFWRQMSAVTVSLLLPLVDRGIETVLASKGLLHPCLLTGWQG